jgi:peptidoglycan/xylan/chitin deacetylase (PgdA/CDA1 family)
MTRRAIAADLLERSGLGPVLRLGRAWRGLLVLCYHRIRDDGATPVPPGPWSATQGGFDAQLRLLKRHFDVVAPSELIDRRDIARERLVALTFDDGYRDNHALALPVLRSHGVRAAFFIATGFVDDPRPAWWDEIAYMVASSPEAQLPAGRWLSSSITLNGEDRRAAVDTLTGVYKRLPGHETQPFLRFLAEETGSGRQDVTAAREDWMTWSMLRDLRDAGMDLGGHSVDHPVLSRIDEGEQQAEVEGCCRRLESELGLPVKLFSYPVGLSSSFDARTRACLRRAGIKLAFSLHGGYVRRRMDPYDVPRASVGASVDASSFRAMTTLPQLFARW